MTEDDQELRTRFAQLKREDRARVPAFRRPSRNAAPRWRPAVRVALAAAVVLVAVVLSRPDQTSRRMARRFVDPGATAWTSPTDFLLITPGSEFMRSVPAVGSPDDWTPIGPRGRAPTPESTRSPRTPS